MCASDLEGGRDVGAAGGQVGGAVAGGRCVDGWRGEHVRGVTAKRTSSVDIVSQDNIKHDIIFNTLDTLFDTFKSEI